MTTKALTCVLRRSSISTRPTVSGRTYHIDVRYEQAFHQIWEIAEVVTEAIKHRRRVIVRHFDLLYPHLNFNAQIILGVGEKVVVARPNVFGPNPDAIKEIVYRTVKYRKMAHSAGEHHQFHPLEEIWYSHSGAAFRREARLCDRFHQATGH